METYIFLFCKHFSGRSQDNKSNDHSFLQFSLNPLSKRKWSLHCAVVFKVQQLIRLKLFLFFLEGTCDVTEIWKKVECLKSVLSPFPNRSTLIKWIIFFSLQTADYCGTKCLHHKWIWGKPVFSPEPLFSPLSFVVVVVVKLFLSVFI